MINNNFGNEKMGTMQNKAVIIHSYKNIEELHQKAVSLFNEVETDEDSYSYPNLVSPIMSSWANGYQTFFIAPDGSKEGWETSNKFDQLLKKFIEFSHSIKTYAEVFIVNWGDINTNVEDVSYGG